jgi:PAS domain S-box-containing protein
VAAGRAPDHSPIKARSFRANSWFGGDFVNLAGNRNLCWAFALAEGSILLIEAEHSPGVAWEPNAAGPEPSMGERIDAFDWAATPLGPRESWPQSLKTLTALMLSAAQPMFMAWGPQKTWLYNDAFVPILGRKHPSALGRPGLDEVWLEARGDLAPLFDQVFSGKPVQMDDFAIDLDRRGRMEEAHFSFSYTPAVDETGLVAGLFGVCTETTEQVLELRRRQNAEAALDEASQAAEAAAERVSLALKAGAIVGTWVWDIRADRLLADAQFAASFGLEPERCRQGLPLETVMASIHSEDRDRVVAAIDQALGRAGPYRCEYRVLRADGAYRWIEASGEVELDVEGRAIRFPGVLVDVHDRRATEEALVNAERLLRTFMQAAPGVIYAKDRQGRLLFGNRGVAELLGVPAEQFVGRTDMELIEDKDEAALVMANDRRVMETGLAEQTEERVTYPDGTEAWWHSTKAPLLDEAGMVVGLIGSSVDITDRRRAEEHRGLLLNELNHRVKNTLAVVQGLARQTFRNADNPQRASESFENRLTALSRAHNLLTDSNWKSAELRDIIVDQLGELGGRAVVKGPRVPLPPQVAVSVALALHELGTNATKYGALSNDSGRVAIVWEIGRDGWLTLRWQETGGPPVSPPERRGFGSRLIERALAFELGGEVQIDYSPQGVVCEIRTPLPG